MRSFFSKIFASFILTMVAATGLCGALFFLLQQANVEEVREKGERTMLYRTAQMALYSGQAAINVYQSQGLRAYRDFVDELKEQTGANIRIFEGTEKMSFAGKEIPRHDRVLYSKALLSQQHEIIRRGPNLHTAKFLQTSSGQSYIILARYSLPPPPPHHLREMNAGDGPPLEFGGRPPGPRPMLYDVGQSIQEFWWAWLVVLSVLGGCSCYFVARSLSSSIRNLRQVTHKLADGNFAARTGLELAQYTGDEVKDLAYDFDKMAARLEKQAERQRTLLRDISHELRSPLARIQVATELVRKGREQNLDKIDENAQRLDTLIGQLLARSRTQLDKEMLTEKVELESLVTDIVADGIFEGQKDDKTVVLRESAELCVRGSSEILRRGLENIIRNGLRFTPPQTTVEVRLSESEAMACIVVMDKGPGVPETELEDIFLPFYRVAKDAPDVDNNGVGLAIAKEAIDFHGGRVVAQNVGGLVGNGLEVRVYLPLLAPENRL